MSKDLARRLCPPNERELHHLARTWVAQYGAAAPAEIRSWAEDPAFGAEGAAWLTRAAQIAELMLQQRKSNAG